MQLVTQKIFVSSYLKSWGSFSVRALTRFENALRTETVR